MRMGKGIVRVCDDPPRYVEWSTVSDSPSTYALTPQELETYIREEYGREGLRDLPFRLARVSKTGTSFHGETPESVLLCNRAGPGETRLGSWAEVVARLDEWRAQEGGGVAPGVTSVRAAIAQDDEIARMLADMNLDSNSTEE